METIRLTAAQAMVRWLAAQMTEEELLDFIRASLPRLSAEGAKRVMRELLEEAYAEAQDAAEC